MLVRATLIVPSVILAEVMTGKASDAAIWRVVNQLTTVDVNTRIAGRAGAIREKAQGARAKKRDLSVDAMVAATAENANASMLITCDVNDMTLLTADSGIRVVGL
jgi:predicted nucleic acid-binding protein